MRFDKTNVVKCGLACMLLALAGCPSQQPTLSLSPTAFTFDQTHLQRIVFVANAGGGSLTWNVTSKPDWLTVSPASGTLSGESKSVTLSADFTDVTPGVHTGELTITSNGGTRAIALSATVVEPPKLEVYPPLVDFGGSALTRTFEIRNIGGGNLTWTVSPPLSNWLSVNPSSGKTGAGGISKVVLTIDRTGLAPGTQIGPVLVQLSSNAGSAVVTAEAVIQYFFVDPTVLDFGTQINQLPLVISNTSDQDDIHWTIDTTVLPAWASLDPSATSGTLITGQSQTILVNVDRTLAGTGSVTGDIRFLTDGGQEAVHLNVQGPTPVLYATPNSFNFGSIKTQDDLTIANTGTGELDWTVEEGSLNGGVFTATDIPWLALSTAAGQTASNEQDSVTLTVDRSQVAANSTTPYTASLRIHSADGQEVIIPLSMLALPPTLKVLPQQLNFGTTYASKNLAIWNDGLGVINWRIDTTGKPSWLAFSPVDGDGIASGSVTGEETDSLKLTVDRTGILPSVVDYAWTFQVTGQDGTGQTLTATNVTVSMNVARVATISIDTGESPDRVPNIDGDRIAFIPLGTTEDSGTFIISNFGTGTLSWQIDTSAFPSWLASVDPSQGALQPLEQRVVTVRVNRKGQSFGTLKHTMIVTSNDPINASVPVRVELEIPKLPAIAVKPSEVVMGLYDVSDTVEVANDGDPGSLLNFQISSTKPWLYFYPETGQSIGTSSQIKDWKDIDITVNRARLTGSGDTGEIVVTAFETDQEGNRRTLTNIAEKRITVSVQAAPLSFEAAQARLRVPSLVRLTMLMRDIAYDALPLPENFLDRYVNSFSIFEQDVAIEASETNQFLTTGSNLRTNVAILLDYTGSMYNAAKTVSDADVSGASDPLQALYTKCVTRLIQELPDNYNVALMEFHDRSQATRFINTTGPDFTTDKDLLLSRLSNVHIVDHGASELLPAVTEAARLLDSADVDNFRRSFDDADVRALICITDGRLTTPPSRPKETLDLLSSLRVRFFPVGWGRGVLHEPLARIAAGTGGHYYTTTEERVGNTETLRPVTSELMNWCATEDPTLSPCDQSVAKDLMSQVVLSYVTLTEDAPITLRVDAKFDNPNDDAGACLPDQGLIGGSLTQRQLDYLSIVGDIRMGQISLRSEGLSGGRARLIVRAEYIPRNIETMQFRIACPVAFNTPVVLGGLLDGWTLQSNGDLYRVSKPANGSPLPYGSFGDMLSIEFQDPIPTAGTTLTFAVTDPVYDAANTQGKYFLCPDTILVTANGSFAPAFPTPQITIAASTSTDRILSFGGNATIREIDLSNIGGSHVPTGVWLNWSLGELPEGLFADISDGTLTSTTQHQIVTFTLDRSIASGVYSSTFNFVFGTNTLSTKEILVPITVLATVQNPLLQLTSNDFLPGTSTINFGTSTTPRVFLVTNAGQSTLHWRVDTATLPAWISLAPSSGSAAFQTSNSVQVNVDTSALTSGNHTDSFQVLSDGGAQTLSVSVDVP